MPSVAALGSAIVMRESDCLEHWYRDFVPWVHYVPMAHDFSNLADVLEWLQAHDTEAEQIGKAGRQFVLDSLCFWYVFLYEYAARLTYEPQVLEYTGAAKR